MCTKVLQTFLIPFNQSFYYFKGSLLIPTPDQDETDFTKGFRVLLDTLAKRKDNQDVRAYY